VLSDINSVQVSLRTIYDVYLSTVVRATRPVFYAPAHSRPSASYTFLGSSYKL